jgi:hypothetical protein
VIVDEADANSRCKVLWGRDGRSLGAGAERYPTSMAGITAGGIPWKHATPADVPQLRRRLGKIFMRGPLWLVEPPETAGNVRIRLDS